MAARARRQSGVARPRLRLEGAQERHRQQCRAEAGRRERQRRLHAARLQVDLRLEARFLAEREQLLVELLLAVHLDEGRVLEQAD